MILSEIQTRAFNKLSSSREWHSAYELQESLNTLYSLVKKGLVIKKLEAGYFAFPRNGILFKAKSL